MVRHALFCAFIVSLPLAPALKSQEVFTPATPSPALPSFAQSLPFPGRPRLRFQLAGTAIRHRFKVDEYVLGLYVDLEALRLKMADGPLTTSGIAKALATGQVPFATVAKFIRGVGGTARAKFAQEALVRYWTVGTFDPEAPDVKVFLSFFIQDVERGGVTEIWMDGRGGMTLLATASPEKRLQSLPVATAFAALTFGEPARDLAMREQLLQGLPSLLASQSAGKSKVKTRH